MAKLLRNLVGLPRFELGTSCTPSKRDTRLRYSPNWGQERFYSSTRSLADVSGFARKSFGGISGGSVVTKALPRQHKLAGSGR